MNFRYRILLLGLLFIGLSSPASMAQGWDYLDVGQGYETLNLAIEGDTTASGAPKSLNRVYRLERGGTYLLNGAVSNLQGTPLRIFAAAGDGPKPLLIMAVDETGASDDPFVLEGDAHLKNLYVSGSNMLGNDGRYGILIYGNGSRVVIDGVTLDFADQAHTKTYGKNCKIYHLNCEFKNGFLLSDMGRGRFFDARGLMPDSLIYINNTFYVNKQRILRFDGAMGSHIILDHNTFYLNAYGGTASTATGTISGPIEINRGINVRVTNNIFQDLGMEAIVHPEGMEIYDRMPIIAVDTVYAPDYPESSRNWLVSNNVYGWAPQVKDFWATMPTTVKGPAFISPWGMDHYFSGHKPNFVAQNNFEEYIQFSDAPPPDAMLDFVKYRFASAFSNEANPDFRADRTGTGSLQDNPETFGPEPDPYNFDYAPTHAAYTAAIGGFPVGDLNWFPDKKTEWEAYMTGVTRPAGVVTSYTLQQNYPNPFNPVTSISFTLPNASRVTLTIYNALGQKVTTLLEQEKKAAGTHTLTWHARNTTGQTAPSGVYYYQLTTEHVQITKKMILVK